MALGILSLLVRLAITTAVVEDAANVVEDAANATAITRPGYARDPTAAEAPVGTAVAPNPFDAPTAAEALVGTAAAELAPVTTHKERVAQRRREWKLNRTRAHDAQAHKHTHAESASCYGRRYPDLAYAFCKDGCNVQALHRHFQSHGRREGRRFGCEAAPLTAAETAKWKVHEARLRAKDPTNPECAALHKRVAAGEGRCRDRATWCSAQGSKKACWPKAACGVCDASSSVPAEAPRSGPCKRPGDRYVVMLSAFEQMNKNIAVVAMVAEWAKRLGRTFVEPMYCRSRVVPPFASLQEGGPVFTKALALPKLRKVEDPRQWSCPGHAKERLGATRDVRDLCTQVPLVSADAFLNRTRHDPTLRDSLEILYFGADLRAAARTTRDKRVIYVVGWHRRVRNDGIAKGACLVSRCHGMLFAPAPRLVEDVRAAAAAARPYTCVNVRTEMTNAVGNPHCPGHIHAAAARAWAALPEAANGTKLIVSDAYASTTGTMDAGRSHRLFSSRLEKLVFGGGAPSRRRLVAVGGPAKDSLRGLLAKQAPGSATAAITEQLLCASAATVVMCNHRGACACGRGLDSGFVSAIKFYRARMGLSVRSDVAGGIFSFK